MIKIDHDIHWRPPIRRYRKWPFQDMEIGDSFFAAGQAGLNASKWCHIWGKRHNRTFTTKQVTEEELNGHRIWRLK